MDTDELIDTLEEMYNELEEEYPDVSVVIATICGALAEERTEELALHTLGWVMRRVSDIQGSIGDGPKDAEGKQVMH